MPTAIVSLTSDLKRKKWMREGLVQAKSKSFWAALTGNSMNSIVYQANNESADSGHTVVFDFDGNLSGKPTKGKETAFGKGEQKKKFSDKITVERYRFPVDNGDRFDGVDIGDLSITEHSDSRTKLGDLWTRFKDQSLFDAAQGNITTNRSVAQSPSHIIDLGTSLTWGDIQDIEKILKTSNGYSTGSVRRPPEPYSVRRGDMGMEEPRWIFLIDSAMANLLRKDTSGWQAVMKDADKRGEENRLIKGIIGNVGALVIVECNHFFGETAGTTTGWTVNASEVEMCGLRQYDGASPGSALWTGQTGFDYSSTNLHSRGVVLGAGAMQMAFGKMPDYKFKSSQDFDIKSESALEVWYEVQKTKLEAENEEYKQATISGIDYGVIAVDVEVQ